MLSSYSIMKKNDFVNRIKFLFMSRKSSELVLDWREYNQLFIGFASS